MEVDHRHEHREERERIDQRRGGRRSPSSGTRPCRRRPSRCRARRTAGPTRRRAASRRPAPRRRRSASPGGTRGTTRHKTASADSGRWRQRGPDLPGLLVLPADLDRLAHLAVRGHASPGCSRNNFPPSRPSIRSSQPVANLRPMILRALARSGLAGPRLSSPHSRRSPPGLPLQHRSPNMQRTPMVPIQATCIRTIDGVEEHPGGAPQAEHPQPGPAPGGAQGRSALGPGPLQAARRRTPIRGERVQASCRTPLRKRMLVHRIVRQCWFWVSIQANRRAIPTRAGRWG